MDARFVNIEDGLGRVMGNKKLYRRMLGLFLEAKEPAALEAALSAGDPKGAAETAHALKGMTGNLGFGPLFALSEKIMIELRAGEASPGTLAAYREAVTGTKEEAARIFAALEAEE